MKKVKVLWAIALGLLYVVLVSFISALIIDTSSQWYLELAKPHFMPPAIVFPVVWSIVYIIFTLTISEMLAKKPEKGIIIAYIILGLVNICYLASFFRGHSTVAGLIFCIIGVLVSCYISYRLIKSNFKFSYLFVLVTLWYLFASILSYNVVLLN